jgi:hypothetical protein
MKIRQSLRQLVRRVARLLATLVPGLSAAQFDLATATIAEIDAALSSGASTAQKRVRRDRPQNARCQFLKFQISDLKFYHL